jgi:hypothetical protein
MVLKWQLCKYNVRPAKILHFKMNYEPTLKSQNVRNCEYEIFL